MRTLDQITTAARRDEPLTEKEARYALCAYDVLLAKLDVSQNPAQLQEYFLAGDNCPRNYIGDANDPQNPDVVEWHKINIGVVDNKENRNYDKS